MNEWLVDSSAIKYHKNERCKDNMKTIEQQLKEMILKEEENNNVDIEKLEQFHLVNDLGFDSMQVIDLIMEIEQKFDFDFDDDEMDIELICDFQELVKLVEQKIAK